METEPFEKQLRLVAAIQLSMIHIRPMNSGDVPFGMRLVAQAGWNQMEADWRRFLLLGPEGCFVAEIAGQPVGTVTTCVFDSVAWIAMLLVDKPARGRGVGTRLMEHVLAELDGRGVRSVRLDATPLGQPIYERLGFVAQYELARMEGTAWDDDRAATLQPVKAEMLDEVVELDRLATQTNRRRLLEQLHSEKPEAMWATCDGSQLAGYAAFRDGRRAVQVGPAVAETPETGRDLLDGVVGRLAGRPIFLDVPLDNAAAVNWAERGGLAVQRRFARMCRGEPLSDHPKLIWASSGPENG